MSTVKKGLLTASGEWKKHLRPYGKREFWKSERLAGKEDAIDSERRSMLDADEDQPLPIPTSPGRP